MSPMLRRTATLTAVGTLAATLAACGGGSGAGSDNAAATAGGTLYYYVDKPVEHTDPQRTYVGKDITNWTRLVYRQLVAFPISTDPAVANKPVPDLATDTGTSSDGAKTWAYTLKDGVTWQDGKPITCDDLKYGASRTFATDVITGGPNYILTYLDLPEGKDGLPSYTGPYSSDAASKAAFDQAITCQGNTITYHFKKPWPDFPLAIASLHMMDPYRQDQDQGNKSNLAVFSDGPYQLQGAWNKEKGATLVRNKNYDKATDSAKVRKALPDKIVFQLGIQTETIYDRLIADAGNDQYAVTSKSVPPAYYSRITGAIAKRSVDVKAPYMEYALPNVKKLTNVKVRQALAMATDQKAYIDAGGGDKAYGPAKSVVNPAVNGYKENPAFADIPESGDPAAAKKLLQAAGVPIPYPITYTYPSSDTQDKQAAALKEGWDKAGFSTTLDGLGDTYYDVVQKPSNDSDVIWGSWGADWPSAITVTPPLFDSRPNLTAASNGQDYGNYKSDAFNALVDKAQGSSDLAAQTTALQEADAQLGQDVAYIPLAVDKFYMLRGSKVTGYETTPSASMYPDLGAIGVQQ